jgi:hypothetical protein
MQPENLNAALRYRKVHQFSVIPVRPDKHPYIKWEEFQKRLPSEQEIREWFTRWPSAMVGIVTGTLSKVCVIDRDTPEAKERLDEVLPDSLLFPIADTPRGGDHGYFVMDEPLGNNAGAIPGVDFRGEGGFIIAPPSVNGAGRAYRWRKGFSIDEVALSPLPSAYKSLIKEFAFKGGIRGDAVNDFKRLQVTSTDFSIGQRDNTLFHIANCLVKGGCEEETTRKVLEMLALQCDPPFDLKDANTKIISAVQRASRRERNISEEVREWVLTSNGFFLTSDVFNGLQLTSRQDQKNCSLALLRMCKAGEIERYGERRGTYRVVDRQCDEIDFLGVTDKAVDIRWPFQLENMVKILPKNIIVIAGEPNAGKTAFLLNVVRMNQDRHKISYFSSEMGPVEFKDRLVNFEYLLNSWKFSPKERTSNFADVIDPDGLNIIDFLEITDEFYKVGGLIREIYDKLNKGVAVIALQKNRGADFGLGGMRGLEKARLYLTLEPGKAKIVKAKNWVDPVRNPNGLTMDFSLVKGARFLTDDSWKKVAA